MELMSQKLWICFTGVVCTLKLHDGTDAGMERGVSFR